jgi:integrase
MGSIYRPKYKDRNGQKRQSSVWWVQYYSRGRKIRESTDTEDFGDAKEYLKRREGDATRGRITKSMERKVLFSELAELVEKDYELNGYRSAVAVELHHRLHVLPYFGKMKATRVSEPDIDDYILQRRKEGASNASINRELCCIKRAYSLGIQKRIVSDRPHIHMLEEDNVRQGFFEREQFESLRKHLPEWVQPVAAFAYITGWRKSEILELQWRQVDFEAGYVRLEPGTTKNREARQFPFTSDLRALLEGQKAKADKLAKHGKICPWVFFHYTFRKNGKPSFLNGKPVGEFKHSWQTACTNAGFPGRLMHDFRRTAVRNLVRAGIPERVAMKMTGHKTRSIFERYNIVSEGDLREAAKRLDVFLAEDNWEPTGASKTERRYRVGSQKRSDIGR